MAMNALPRYCAGALREFRTPHLARPMLGRAHQRRPPREVEAMITLSEKKTIWKAWGHVLCIIQINAQ